MLPSGLPCREARRRACFFTKSRIELEDHHAVAKEPLLNAPDCLSAEERAQTEALLVEVIAALRASGREPQQHQFVLGLAFADRLRELSFAGVAWATRVRQLHARRIELGLEAVLRQHGIEPD